MKKTAIVLQGGGALGAYQLGALKRIYKEHGFSPSFISGVSIGAVNAAVLAGGKYGPIKSLEKLWDSVKMNSLPMIPQDWQAMWSKFGNPSMYNINSRLAVTPLTAKSIYDITPFYELLIKLIDFDKLNDQDTAEIIIEAVNVETGLLEIFSNKKPNGINIKHIIASMSIPPNFPAVEIDNKFYWDGGLYANMPLGPAIKFLERKPSTNRQESENIERELIIISLFKKQAKLPNNIYEISNRIKEIMFESKLSLDNRYFEKMNNMIELMEKIGQIPNLPDNIKQDKLYQKLAAKKRIKKFLLQYKGEGVEGTDNFTDEAIKQRIRDGYRDAEAEIFNKCLYQH